MNASAKGRGRKPLLVVAALALVATLGGGGGVGAHDLASATSVGAKTWGQPWGDLPPPVEERQPSKPTGLTATSEADGVRLDWDTPDAADGVTGYRILRRVKGSGTPNLTQLEDTATTDTTYLDEDVQAGSTYFYRIRALAGTEQSGKSKRAKITHEPPQQTSLTFVDETEPDEELESSRSVERERTSIRNLEIPSQFTTGSHKAWGMHVKDDQTIAVFRYNDRSYLARWDKQSNGDWDLHSTSTSMNGKALSMVRTPNNLSVHMQGNYIAQWRNPTVGLLPAGILEFGNLVFAQGNPNGSARIRQMTSLAGYDPNFVSPDGEELDGFIYGAYRHHCWPQDPNDPDNRYCSSMRLRAYVIGPEGVGTTPGRVAGSVDDGGNAVLQQLGFHGDGYERNELIGIDMTTDGSEFLFVRNQYGNGAYQFNIPSNGDYATYCGELLFESDDSYSALHYDGSDLWAFHDSFSIESYDPLNASECTFDENERNDFFWPRPAAWNGPINPKDHL